MFNFNKTFKNTTRTGSVLPKEYVDYLSKSAPQGTKYIPDTNGYVILTPTGDSTSISGFTFDPSLEQKHDLGDTFSPNDLLNYIYNSQQPMKIKLLKPGMLVINGAEFPVEKIAYMPRRDIVYGEGIVEVFPQPFPGPFDVVISNSQYSVSLKVMRKPNRSISEELYESAEDSILSLRFIINRADETVKMTLNFAFSKAKTVREVVECMSIVNSWGKGESIINGRPFPYQPVDDQANLPNETTVVFWEKVLAVESSLGEHFDIPEKAPSMETISAVEMLFQGLVNLTPVICKEQIDSVTSEVDETSIKPPPINQELLVEMCCTFETEVLGRILSLPAIIMVFNAQLSKIERKGNKQTIVLSDVSEEKRRYTVVLPFKDKDSLLAYQSKDQQQKIEAFRTAKLPSDYL